MAGFYTFLPWLTRGIANQITQRATVASRASVTATVTASDGETAVDRGRTFLLTGPGDVVGLDPDAIVRVEPKNWITDFEPNYLAFVEFYDEDFPWRYTPRGPEGANERKLIPWLTLLVLKPEEFERNRAPGRPLTSVIIKTSAPASLFPVTSQLWAWAHVQIAEPLGNATAPDQAMLEDVLSERPDVGLSRILSPRRLEPNAAYHAFVVPSYEVGRLAGLGIAFDDTATWG